MFDAGNVNFNKAAAKNSSHKLKCRFSYDTKTSCSTRFK